jgi:hypothetical protein
MLKRFALFLAILGLLVAPALAQDRGIAFATATNGSYGACFDTDMDAAASCALDQCVNFSGLTIDECNVTLWCAPNSWTAALLITPVDGSPYFDFLCNEPTFDKLNEVAAVTCAYEGYTSCEIAQVWDPDAVAQYEQQ